MRSAIKAVVLDWAGTMIDYGSRAPVVALQRLFEQAGVAISEAEARADMGRAKRDHIRAILAIPRVSEVWLEKYGASAGDGDVEKMHDAVAPIMREAARDCSDLIPGAAELAIELRKRGVPIGSCTGYTREMMADILPRAAAQGYTPDVVICSGDTPEGRPTPLMLWKAFIELGVWPAWVCVKVDDATVGILEGKAAGSWTVGIAASGNGVGLTLEELEALSGGERTQRIGAAKAILHAVGADYVIESVADLAPILDQIETRIEAGEKPSA